MALSLFLGACILFMYDDIRHRAICLYESLRLWELWHCLGGSRLLVCYRWRVAALVLLRVGRSVVAWKEMYGSRLCCCWLGRVVIQFFFNSLVGFKSWCEPLLRPRGGHQCSYRKNELYLLSNKVLLLHLWIELQ